MLVARRAFDVEVVIRARGFCSSSKSKSLRVLVVRRAFDVEVVIRARGFCSLLVPVARGSPEVEIVTAARGPPGSRCRCLYWCPRPVGLIRPRSLLVPAASACYWRPWPAWLPRSKLLLAPVALWVLEVEVVYITYMRPTYTRTIHTRCPDPD